MVQTTIDKIREDDTGALFRDDALRVRLGLENLDPDDGKYDPTLYELGPHRGTGTPQRKRDSEQEKLARMSGQVVDDMTPQGHYNSTYGGSNANPQQAAIRRAQLESAGITGWISSSINSVTSTVGGWFDSAYDYGAKAVDAVSQGFNDYIYNPLAELGGNIKQGFNSYIAQPFDKYIAQPAVQAYESATTWAGNKVTQAKNAASGAWESTKSFFGYGSDEQPAQQRPQAAQQQVSADRPSASTQTLAGEKSNPSTEWSLSGMFASASNAIFGSEEPTARSAPKPTISRTL